MRLLEMLLTLACAAWLIRFASAGRSDSAHWTLGAQILVGVLLIAQVAVEGWRWQMFPAYAAALFTVVTPALLGMSAGARFCSSTASLGLLAASVMSCLLLPFVAPRTPRGPYAVGVAQLPAIQLHPFVGGTDELKAAPLVRLWYPAQRRRLPIWGCLDERMAAGFRAQPCLPYARDAALAASSGRFPILIYFDGWPEDRIQNIDLILELASRGFVVASVEFPTIAQRPMIDYSSDAAFERSVREDHARARAHAQDAVAVLNALDALDKQAGNNFARRLDTNRAGTLGFSFGGAIAAEASRVDPRIKAVVNMDGRHWGDSLERGVERPYMFICEELTMPTAADLASSDPTTRYEARLDQVDYSRLAANQQALGGIRVTIAGMAHMNFTDVPLRSPLRRLSGGGAIDPRRAQFLIQTYVVEFFSRYLLSSDPPGLDAPLPQFPEVRVQSWIARKAVR